MSSHKKTHRPFYQLRAFWYCFEVASQEDDDTCSGIVYITWAKGSSIWDYTHDQVAYDSLVRFEKTCLPVRRAFSHVCCPSSVMLKTIRPIVFALLSKRSRARSMWHAGPEQDVLNTIAGYGMTKDMLPSVMGGSCRLDQLEWMAKRRSIEMEEIS